LTNNTQLPNEKKTWLDLIEEATKIKSTVANEEKKLATQFVIKKCGITVDFSRQNINSKILKKLIFLAEDSQLKQKMLEFYSTKNKATFSHTVLRAGKKSPILENQIKGEVEYELEKFLFFADQLRSSKILGWRNNPIKNVVVLGLGGSVLGPKFATEALKSNDNSKMINLFFVSNPDCCYFNEILQKLKPSETLFLIQSKSFKTPEILILKNYARRWMLTQGCSNSDLKKHFSVVTANLAKSRSEGYLENYTFRIWDWIRGRFSVWSSMGLPLAISIGTKKFREFLNGAKEMDDHFLNTDFSLNLPILSALISLWNRSFLNIPSYVVATYSSKLDQLVTYLQQLDMESLGKNVHTNGELCQFKTGQIVWGGPGIEGQHAYFQLLHQGKEIIPIDFYGLKESSCVDKSNDLYSAFMLSSLKAQADALFFGDKKNNFFGNRPSTIFCLDEITPQTLGSLLSMQEHKIFVLACIWNINPFDQPGVELGKKLLLKRFEGKIE
tara:strand:+ start:48 stop:1544 length:1497 start_codon:yes stop_codon:yes gene_type:complete